MTDNSATASKSTMHLFDLTNKTALVTGGTGWLGQAFSEALAEAGANVIVSSRELARAQTAITALPTAPDQQHAAVAIDQTNAASIRDGFQQAVDKVGRVDILVNNGLSPIDGDLTDVGFDAFADHQVNNAGYFELARLVHDHVVGRQASGSIINVGSMYGLVGSYPDTYQGICSASSVAYHALKGGTLQMTRHLAVYWAEEHVRVNCLSPGPFPNPATVPATLLERLAEKSPMKRMGDPRELKGAIVFLASDASSYMTGQNLTIDGGWTAW